MKSQDKIPNGVGFTRMGQTHARIRSDIVRGVLAPASKLLIEEMCDRYGVTSTPVREALSQLTTEGFVQRIEQRGFFVASISFDALRELTDTRCWIEEVALRQSLAHRTRGWEDTLVLATHHLSRTPRSLDAEVFQANPEWEIAHRRFHMSLIAACPSRWLLDFCERLFDHASRYRAVSMSMIFPLRDVGTEHRALMDAAVMGPVEEAVQLLSSHYRRTTQIVTELVLDDRGATDDAASM